MIVVVVNVAGDVVVSLYLSMGVEKQHTHTHTPHGHQSTWHATRKHTHLIM